MIPSALFIISTAIGLTTALGQFDQLGDDIVTSCISPEVARELIIHFNNVNYMLIAVLVFGAMMLLLFIFITVVPKLAGGFANKQPTLKDLVE